MELFDKSFTERIAGVVDYHIDTFEVVSRFYYIIYIERSVFHADGVGFKNVASLIVGQSAPLNVIGVIGQFDLHLVINATRYL